MTIAELIFGKKEPPQLTDVELEVMTVRKEAELRSKTRILRAQTEYDKARVEHNKVIAANPKLASGGLVGILSKKSTWFIVVGILFVVVLISKVF